MRARYRCLVVDHDDTVVNSTATVHYPCFVQYVNEYFPHYRCTLEEYFIKNFDPGVVAFFRDDVGMTDQQMRHEQEYWNEYVQTHVPSAYEGIDHLLFEQKKRGGLVCVVSHSYAQNIRRDYRENGLPEPDAVFGWEVPSDRRKPKPWALTQIMRQFDLEPSEMLVVDDLKPGYDMARAAGVPFAAAGWANDIEPIESYMRAHSDRYFKSISELYDWLFD